MNTFPFFAALTIGVSFASLSASIDALREADSLLEANEGLLDHELASADPIQAWLDRTLTPPTDYYPPAE